VHQWSRVPKQWRLKVAETADSILLETSRFLSGSPRSLLFLDPVRVISVARLNEIPALFQQIEEALAAGFYVAGFVGYECGYHFQSLEDVAWAPSELPLAWFGVYREPSVHHHTRRSEEGGIPQPLLDDSVHLFDLSSERQFLTIPEELYCAKIERIQEYIRAGETYQVNFTDCVDARTSSSVLDAFTTLSQRQPVSYGAFLNVNGNHILSFSPELFFHIDDGRILTRPMKGTMPRGLDSIDDGEAASQLQHDEKNRAEHVMIVDLLRNDLGRICTMGSVQVEDLFTVEKYSTLFQMTSTISGTLRPGLRYYDVFRSMFPSGSITGAPKIRTMKIIRELEQRPRGVYTGAIGFIAPDRSSIFNFAIRTLIVKDRQVRMGVGGGIVADSHPLDEYKECQLKANFLTRTQPTFQLIETMLWDGRFSLLSMHLDRMESSASYFDFPFDRDVITAQLLARSNCFPAGAVYRVRLMLDATGDVTITAAAYVHDSLTASLRLSPERISSRDVFLRHKTTHRDRYDRLHAEARAAGFDEILFLNEREEVAEGAISNIFIQHEGKLFTPPLSSGVLPGVFRRHLLESDASAEERVLRLQDLESAESIFLCNAVRGIRRVNSLFLHPMLRTLEAAAL